MRRAQVYRPLRQARQERRQAELERHLKAALYAIGQAHVRAVSKARSEMILALINTARGELESAEDAIWKSARVKA